MDPTSTSPADRIIDAAESLETGQDSIEQRRQKRFEYGALVAVILMEPDGRRSAPMVLRAHDISSGGLSVACSRAFPDGAEGVLQLVRTNGQFALVGVEVRHCRYLGSMMHRVGLKFAPVPAGFTREEFFDEKGRMMLLDPLLRTNVAAES